MKFPENEVDGYDRFKETEFYTYFMKNAGKWFQYDLIAHLYEQ